MPVPANSLTCLPSARPEAYYSRLCPAPAGNWAPHDENALVLLAELMRDDPEKREERRPAAQFDHMMRSGHVYFGQFVAHDLSWERDSLGEANPEVERTANYRTPRLDLDLLYGDSPEATPFLYESHGRLKLGTTEPDNGEQSTVNDLPRDSEGIAQVADSRSDDHLLIAQVQVLMARFHNRVCDLLTEQPALSAGPAGANLFEQARRFVTWHYQWIVLHEFLPLLIQSATLRDLECNGPRLFPRTFTPADAPIALPVEFTLAAFRFGHTMVRPDYFLNPFARIVEAADLIRMTKRGGGIARRLPAKFVISWPRFFGGSDATVNRAENIDTFLTPALYEISALAPAMLGRTGLSLPAMTLQRGSRVRLPSGQEFIRRFGFAELPAESVAARDEDQEFFRESGFNQRTPLWYYLLREAAVEAVFEPEAPGRRTVQKLGTAGGRIVAETFHQVLHADENSIKHAGKAWRPPAFVFGEVEAARRLDSMKEIARFAHPGSAQPAPAAYQYL